MRVERERMITLALAVLHRAVLQVGRGPMRHAPDVRLALAVLYRFSRSGERANYDAFWANARSDHADAYSEELGNVGRVSTARTLFERILRDVGAPRDVEYHAKLAQLVSGPLPHPWRPGTGSGPAREDVSS